MATSDLGAESVHDNVLQFPQRNKGRVRKSKGPQAEGVLAMAQFATYPDNVEHFDRDRFDEVSALDLVAFGFNALYRELPIETRIEVKRSAMISAALDRNPDKRTIAALFSGAFTHRHEQ